MIRYTHMAYFFSSQFVSRYIRKLRRTQLFRFMDKFSVLDYRVKVFIAVSLYWFVSITLVFVNKFLLSSKVIKIDAPLFVTWFQCVISIFICYFVSKLSQRFKSISFPIIKFEKEKLIKILPLSVVMLLMITFNNLCLKYVTVSFYQIGRSLTTVFNVIFTFIILGQKTSFKAILCCAALIAGFYLGVDQEDKIGSISWIGVFFGVGASAFVALNAIFTKKILPIVDEDVWQLCFYNNINAAYLFLPLIVFNGEINELMKLFPIGVKTGTAVNSNLTPVLFFWGFLLVSGILGFMIGFVTGLQIQVTSPLTHNVSGTAKACVQTLLAVLLLSEIKNLLWWVGNTIVILAAFAYTYVRHSEMKPKTVENPENKA